MIVRRPKRLLRRCSGDRRTARAARRQPGSRITFIIPDIRTTMRLNPYCLKKNVSAERMTYAITTAPAALDIESFRVVYTPIEYMVSAMINQGIVIVTGYA